MSQKPKKDFLRSHEEFGLFVRPSEQGRVQGFKTEEVGIYKKKQENTISTKKAIKKKR